MVGLYHVSWEGVWCNPCSGERGSDGVCGVVSVSTRVLEFQKYRPQAAVPRNGDAGLDEDGERDALAAELAFERALFASRRLSVFRRNATTWEVLLMLAAVPEGEGPGLHELVEDVRTRALGASALLLFLRDRREEGTIVFTRSARKQSKWCLSLRPDLRRELMTLLALRVPGGG